jgi:hypothetical protein
MARPTLSWVGVDFGGYHPSLAQLPDLAKASVSLPTPVRLKGMGNAVAVGPQHKSQQTGCLSGLVRCHRTVDDQHAMGRQGRDAPEEAGVLLRCQVVRDLPAESSIELILTQVGIEQIGRPESNLRLYAHSLRQVTRNREHIRRVQASYLHIWRNLSARALTRYVQIANPRLMRARKPRLGNA